MSSAACLHGSPGVVTIGILVLALTALIPCTSVFFVADWLGSCPSKAFIAACPEAMTERVRTSPGGSRYLPLPMSDCPERDKADMIGLSTSVLLLEDVFALLQERAFSLEAQVPLKALIPAVQRSSGIQTAWSQLSQLIAGPQHRMPGRWWDQGQMHSSFVDKYGVLFDTNFGHIYDLTKRRPSITMRIPNRSVPLHGRTAFHCR